MNEWGPELLLAVTCPFTAGRPEEVMLKEHPNRVRAIRLRWRRQLVGRTKGMGPSEALSLTLKR